LEEDNKTPHITQDTLLFFFFFFELFI